MGERWRTAQLAAASGYCVQQIRDLERLGVIPPAARAANNYRQFTHRHLVALRVYRAVATAAGPVVARGTLRAVLTVPHDEAVAMISALHIGLTRERTDALAALEALHTIRAEAATDPDDPHDALSITELAGALGVRTSTLRFWEQEELIVPERVTSYRARRYPPAAVREARIAAALRAAGYPVPAVRDTLHAIRGLGEVDDPVQTLQDRLTSIARRMTALLDAGADITRLLATS